jgi:glutathione S-transferase
VPCITDTNGQTIQDSRKIAHYLEERYPTPSIFHGGVGVHFFFENWVMDGLTRRIFQLCVMKMFNMMDQEARQYYRESREKMLGRPLEIIAGEPEEHIVAIIKDLGPVNKILEDCRYITGNDVGWADIVLASMLKPVQITHLDVFDSRILNQHNNIKLWWDRMEKYADISK